MRKLGDLLLVLCCLDTIFSLSLRAQALISGNIADASGVRAPYLAPTWPRKTMLWDECGNY